MRCPVTEAEVVGQTFHIALNACCERAPVEPTVSHDPGEAPAPL